MSLNPAEVLSRIVERAGEVAAAGRAPVVVLDLDHTLFDNGGRTWHILAEFVEREGRYDLRRRLNALPHGQVAYTVGEVLASIGEVEPAFVEAATRFWGARFFTDTYIRFDVPLAGARGFCVALFERGATLVYLSGRDSSNMLVGTAESLRRHGFPVGISRTTIVLKPSLEKSDVAFKSDMIGFVERLGEVVAAIDNEPANCNLFRARWPDAFVLWADTAHAPNPPALAAGVAVIADFVR